MRVTPKVAASGGRNRRWLDRRIDLWIRQELIGPVLMRLLVPVRITASLWRRLLRRTTFIAITGSVGKTTAKQLLAGILENHGRTYRTIANQNGGLLVSLNVLRVRPWHRYAVLEVATGGPGGLKHNARMVRPDVAVILAVRRTHTTSFTDLDEYAREKSLLVKALSPRGTAVLYADDPRVARMANDLPQKVIRFGSSPQFDLWSENVSGLWPERLCFDAHWGSEHSHIETQLVGEHWLPSVLGALAAACSTGVPLESAARAVRRVQPFPGRMQPVRLPNGATILRDDYNGSIDGTEAAFRVLERAQASRRLLVITDLSDFGADRRQRLRYLGSLSPTLADVLVVVGERADYGRRRAIEAGLAPQSAFAFADIQDAAKFLKNELRAGDLVLLKGRTTDHIARVFFAQMGTVACWKPYCPKTMLCDECWELGLSGEDLQQIETVPPERTATPSVIAPHL